MFFGLSYELDISFEAYHSYYDFNEFNKYVAKNPIVKNPIVIKIEKCCYCGKERAYFVHEFGIKDNKKHFVDIDTVKIKCKKSIEEARKQK